MARPQKLPDGIVRRGSSYFADFRAGGRRIRKRLSTNLEAARQIVNDLRARADKADFNLVDNDYPVAELKAEFLRHCRQSLKASTASRYESCLKTILPRLGATKVAQITGARLRSYRQERLDEGKTARTVNMEVVVLSGMLTWATKIEKKIGSNPIADLKPLPHNPKEGRALMDEEVKRLLERSPAAWRDVWYALLVTGLRKAELASMAFDDIDWSNREIVVRGSVAKNHQDRRIPIDCGLWDILTRLRDGRKGRKPGSGQTPAIAAAIQASFTKDRVFVTRANTPFDHRSNLYHAFMRCCRLADIQTQSGAEHVDLHSLRRTFATNLITSGADPKSVQDLLGHATLEMTMKIYTKIHGQTKRQALGKLSYGRGTLAPEHVIEYPGGVEFSRQNGHSLDTNATEKTGT